MKLGALLAADRIVLEGKGETVREAAQHLVHAVIASGHVLDPERLEALLGGAVPGEAVTLGQRAFLLHFRSDAVDRLTVALGVTAVPVRREHDAGKEGRVVLLVVAPPRETPKYLRTVGTFARALAREDVVAGLEAAATADDVLGLAALTEAEVSNELLVRHVCAPRPQAIGPDATLGQAAELLAGHQLPAVPVVSEDDDVLGMVSYGDVLRYLLPVQAKRISGEHAGAEIGEEADPLATPVRDVMDRSVLCISEDQPLLDVARVMVNKRLDRVPVVREGALVGLLTREEIVRRLFGV